MSKLDYFRVWDINDPVKFKLIESPTPTKAKSWASKNYFQKSNYLDLRARKVPLTQQEKVISQSNSFFYRICLANGLETIIYPNELINELDVICVLYKRVWNLESPYEFKIYSTSAICTLTDMIHLYNGYVSEKFKIIQIDKMQSLYKRNESD